MNNPQPEFTKGIEEPVALGVASATATHASYIPASSKANDELTTKVAQREGGTADAAHRPLYLPLGTMGREIRLLLFQPALSLSDPLNGFLSTVTLSSAPTYVALSYEWGVQAKDIKTGPHIQVNEHQVPLRPNLADALENIREHLAEPVLIWIDAICINQQNPEERGAQVQLMKQIYESASGVWVWLGLSKDSSDLAIDVIEQIQHFPEDTRPKLSRSNRWITKLLTDPEYEARRFALRQLFLRPYWERLWIVQEVVLGACTDMPLLYCGRRRVLLGLVLKFAKGVRDANIGTSKPNFQAPDSSSELVEAARLAIALAEHIYEYSCGDDPDAFRALTRYNRNLCSDPRDKVYGLLGLTSNLSTNIPVDYSISPVELCIQIATFIVQKSSHSTNLDFLSSCNLSDGDDNAEDDPTERPSWVPNWLSKDFEAPALKLRWRSEILKSEMSSVSSYNRGAYISGRSLRTESILYGSLAAILQIREHDGLNMGEDYLGPILRGVYKDLTPIGIQISEPNFLQVDAETTTASLVYNTLFCNDLGVSRRDSSTENPAVPVAEFIAWAVRLLRDERVSPRPFPQVERAKWHTAMEQRQRYLFLYIETYLASNQWRQRWHLGICVNQPQLHDKVALIKDCRYPLLLRTGLHYSRFNKTYKVVGECYVPSAAEDIPTPRRLADRSEEAPSTIEVITLL